MQNSSGLRWQTLSERRRSGGHIDTGGTIPTARTHAVAGIRLAALDRGGGPSGRTFPSTTARAVARVGLAGLDGGRPRAAGPLPALIPLRCRSLLLDLMLLTVVARAVFFRAMFDRLALRFVTARADPDSPVIAVGAMAGATRKVVARNGIRNYRTCCPLPGSRPLPGPSHHRQPCARANE